LAGAGEGAGVALFLLLVSLAGAGEGAGVSLAGADVAVGDVAVSVLPPPHGGATNVQIHSFPMFPSPVQLFSAVGAHSAAPEYPLMALAVKALLLHPLPSFMRNSTFSPPLTFWQVL